MWDVVILNKIDNLYLVMAPNGDTKFIDQETLNKLIEQKRTDYEKS